jgi:hypothetical protein
MHLLHTRSYILYKISYLTGRLTSKSRLYFCWVPLLGGRMVELSWQTEQYAVLIKHVTDREYKKSYLVFETVLIS